MSFWELAEPCVPACTECGAPGDVLCTSGCSQAEFREAEMDGVIEQ